MPHAEEAELVRWAHAFKREASAALAAQRRQQAEEALRETLQVGEAARAGKIRQEQQASAAALDRRASQAPTSCTQAGLTAVAMTALPEPVAAAGQQGPAAMAVVAPPEPAAAEAPQGPAATEAQHSEWWEAYLTPGKGRRWLLRCALLKTMPSAAPSYSPDSSCGHAVYPLQKRLRQCNSRESWHRSSVPRLKL